jgi:hypothetical protein
MIKRDDFKAVHEELLAERRRSAGAPPTDEELLAFASGELNAADEARVRELLVAYPELARAVSIPFPDGDVEPLPEEVVNRQWSALQKRLHAAQPQPSRRALRIWQSTAAIAATLVLVLGGQLWKARSETEQTGPIEEVVLRPEGRRGGPAEPIPLPYGAPLVLKAYVAEGETFTEYRMDIVTTSATPRVVRSTSGLRQHDEDGAVWMLLPKDTLDAGQYRLILYGVSGEGAQRLGSYSFRVATPS